MRLLPIESWRVQTLSATVSFQGSSGAGEVLREKTGRRLQSSLFLIVPQYDEKAPLLYARFRWTSIGEGTWNRKDCSWQTILLSNVEERAWWSILGIFLPMNLYFQRML